MNTQPAAHTSNERTPSQMLISILQPHFMSVNPAGSHLLPITTKSFLYGTIQKQEKDYSTEKNGVTKRQFNTLEDLFNFYNETLFKSELPPCLVNLSRHRGAHGFFAPERWHERENGEAIHEISLNPDTMTRPAREWQSTLVHEMAHLWQAAHGKPSRNGYHNRQWANKMKTVGLMPTDTGAPGGKTTGQSMSHYIIEGGPFASSFAQIGELTNLALPYLPTPLGDYESKKSANKVKYECPCGCNVWGKPGLSIHCNFCHFEFIAVDAHGDGASEVG